MIEAARRQDRQRSLERLSSPPATRTISGPGLVRGADARGGKRRNRLRIGVRTADRPQLPGGRGVHALRRAVGAGPAQRAADRIVVPVHLVVEGDRGGIRMLVTGADLLGSGGPDPLA